MNKDYKSKIKALLKRYRILYRIYFFVMTAFVNVVKLFVRPDEKLLLFVSFGGRRFTDSPKSIYDFMRKDSRFSDYKLVCGLLNPIDYPSIEKKVKLDTLAYYITALKARCWITNVSIERGLGFKGKKTYYLYTGHGSPIKKCGVDENNNNHYHAAAKSLFDASLAQSEFEKKNRSRLMCLSEDKVYLTGAPTNDILANYDDTYRTSIRLDLGIKDGKKAILYAPTFREYRNVGTFDTPDVNFEKWHHLLGPDYVILYRAHPIAMTDNMTNNDWFIDVTKYNSIEPLMIASDILVSDYSGLIPDYSIMHKPIYLWTYDYEQYEEARGLYFDIRKVLPYAEREEELLQMIKDGYTDTQKEAIIKFQQKYATVYGSATENAVDLIYRNINENEK